MRLDLSRIQQLAKQLSRPATRALIFWGRISLKEHRVAEQVKLKNFDTLMGYEVVNSEGGAFLFFPAYLEVLGRDGIYRTSYQPVGTGHSLLWKSAWRSALGRPQDLSQSDIDRLGLRIRFPRGSEKLRKLLHERLIVALRANNYVNTARKLSDIGTFDEIQYSKRVGNKLDNIFDRGCTTYAGLTSPNLWHYLSSIDTSNIKDLTPYGVGLGYFSREEGAMYYNARHFTDQPDKESYRSMERRVFGIPLAIKVDEARGTRYLEVCPEYVDMVNQLGTLPRLQPPVAMHPISLIMAVANKFYKEAPEVKNENLLYEWLNFMANFGGSMLNQAIASSIGLQNWKALHSTVVRNRMFPQVKSITRRGDADVHFSQRSRYVEYLKEIYVKGADGIPERLEIDEDVVSHLVVFLNQLYIFSASNKFVGLVPTSMDDFVFDKALIQHNKRLAELVENRARNTVVSGVKAWVQNFFQK